MDLAVLTGALQDRYRQSAASPPPAAVRPRALPRDSLMTPGWLCLPIFHQRPCWGSPPP